MLIFNTQRCASAACAMALCLSVPFSVCPSHDRVLSKLLKMSCYKHAIWLPIGSLVFWCHRFLDNPTGSPLTEMPNTYRAEKNLQLLTNLGNGTRQWHSYHGKTKRKFHVVISNGDMRMTLSDCNHPKLHLLSNVVSSFYFGVAEAKVFKFS